MKNQLKTLLIVVAVVAFVQSTFILREGHQALVVQFGRIVSGPITEAGLNFKVPFIQQARIFDKRILEWDGDPERIPTGDKKYIWVDTTARWKIVDAVKFAETLQTERGAFEKIDAILDGATRDLISSKNLVEAVRNSNQIIKVLEERRKSIEERNKAPIKKLNEDGSVADVKKIIENIDDEVTGEVEAIKTGRDKLSILIADRARDDLAKLGIELVDVQLRRIAYEKSVEDKVFERMISERKRIAEKIRSIGKGEEAKIKGKLNYDLEKIQSEAYRTSQKIRGEGEAKAIAIYASAMRSDPEFYKFSRTLEAYKKTLNEKTQFIISTDNDFLKVYRDGK